LNGIAPTSDTTIPGSGDHRRSPSSGTTRRISPVTADETAADEARHERHILVCYDGSPESARELERAAELASAVPSRVTVVSVAEPIYRTRPYSGYADPAEEEAHRSLLEEATRRLAGHGIAAATLESSGVTAAAIVEAADETRADLVIVGSRPRGLIRRLLFGSVSGRLVAESPADVLVVR
jgi:nucleotide-binding universal stress UspA family protein